jgi:hypothetical protein
LRETTRDEEREYSCSHCTSRQAGSVDDAYDRRMRRFFIFILLGPIVGTAESLVPGAPECRLLSTLGLPVRLDPSTVKA